MAGFKKVSARLTVVGPFGESKEGSLYKKVLLAYDGSIEGRRALREGARIAQLCSAEVFLLAVVEVSAGTGTLDGGFVLPITEQIKITKRSLRKAWSGSRLW